VGENIVADFRKRPTIIIASTTNRRIYVVIRLGHAAVSPTTLRRLSYNSANIHEGGATPRFLGGPKRVLKAILQYK